MAKWLLDAGHGGTDPGATKDGRYEKNDTLKLALKVGEILKANGETAGYTRTTDTTVSLTNRCNTCNNGKYDYFISFHRDSFTSIASGSSVFVYGLGGKAEQLGKKVDTFLDTLFVDRGGVKVANYQVLRNTNCPAILIEFGFINNPSDNGVLDDNFDKICNGVASACLNYIGKTLVNTGVNTQNVAKGVYRVICGSYGVKANAEKRQSELSTKGFSSFLAFENNLYRVVCGSYSKKENAENQKSLLLQNGFDSFLEYK